MVAGSRHPIFARAGTTENNFSAVKKLFTPRPPQWEKMIKWYGSKGVDEVGYARFLKTKYTGNVLIQTLLPHEVKELISLGALHAKEPKELAKFTKKWGKEEKK